MTVLDARRVGELRRHPVIGADHPVAAHVGDLHRLGMAEVAGADPEAAAVNADQEPVLVLLGDAPLRNEHLGVDARDPLRGDLHGVLGDGVPVDGGLVVALGDALARRTHRVQVAGDVVQARAALGEGAELRPVHLAEVLHRRPRLLGEVGGLRQVERRDVNRAVRFHAGTFVLLRGLRAGHGAHDKGDGDKAELVSHDGESRRLAQGSRVRNHGSTLKPFRSKLSAPP